jgi:Tol biopolymer transport system component
MCRSLHLIGQVPCLRPHLFVHLAAFAILSTLLISGGCSKDDNPAAPAPTPITIYDCACYHEGCELLPSPDESKIAFTTSDDAEIWMVSMAGGTPAPTSFPSPPNVESVGLVAWLNNDSDLVWSAYMSQGQRMSFMSNVANNQTTALTSPDPSSIMMEIRSVSPDGSHLAWSDADALWTTKLDGSEPTKLCEAPYIGRLSWSPDGATIAWFDADRRISIIPAVGGAVTQITDASIGEVDSHFGWAPTGDRIAVMASPDWDIQPTTLYAVPIAGGTPTALASASQVGSPVWSADGKRIAFGMPGPDENWDVWTVDSTGGAAAVRLNTGARDDIPVAWVSGGSRLLIASYDNDRIYVWTLPL